MSVSDDDLPPGIIRSRPRTAEQEASPTSTPKPAWQGDSGNQVERADRTARSWKAGRMGRTEEARPEPDSDLHFDPVGKAREDAYFFLSYRDRSEKEMVEKLRKRNHTDDVIDEVLVHLRAEGYLNDANFARRLVESRGKTRGARALTFELKRKGIEGELAQEALAERGDSESGDEDADRAAAWLAATRRVGQPPVADSSPTAAKRLSAFLQRRGFSFGTIRSVMRELFAGGDAVAGDAEEFEG